MTKNVVQQIRRATRRQFTSEEKIRIVLEGLRGEISVAEALPPRRHQPHRLLPLVQGLPGGRQERPRAGYPPGCHGG